MVCGQSKLLLFVAPNSRSNSVKGTNITGIEAKSRSFPPHGFDFADETLGLSLIRAVDEDDIRLDA